MEVVNPQNYPLLAHFGKQCRRLPRDAAAAASFNERFASIGRLTVGRAIKFYVFVLSCEGRITYDAEDIFLELWAELRHRNDKYEPALGEYVTFARRVIANKLSEMLEETHCVRLPANATEKFNELLLLDPDTLTSRQRHRLAALVAANVDHASIRFSDSIPDAAAPPDVQAEQSELGNLTNKLVTRCVMGLSCLECLAIGYRYGLWSRTKTHLSVVDQRLRLKRGTMSRAFATGMRKMRGVCLDRSGLSAAYRSCM